MKSRQLVSLEDMIMLLRIQKHDILNHLQVVGGFLQLQKHDLAQDYLKVAIAQIQQEGTGLKIQCPQLVGVLYRYKAKGEQMGMTVDIEIDSEMLELGEESCQLAGAFKELFELVMVEPMPLGSKLKINFIENGDKKTCKWVFDIANQKVESIKAYIDSIDFAYYNQSGNQWIIVFAIEQ